MQANYDQTQPLNYQNMDYQTLYGGPQARLTIRCHMATLPSPHQDQKDAIPAFYGCQSY